jgi:FkbM family methyltransferase
MPFLYKIIYHPVINLILRNLLNPISKALHTKLPISISGKLSLSYRGKTFHLNTNQTCSVTQVLFTDGCEAYEFTPLFEHLIKQSSVFFDVGANIGYFTVLAEKLNETAKIFSFEPSVGPKYYLNANVKSNRLKNVKVIEKAVAEVNGTLEFYEVINEKYPWVENQLSGSNSLQNQFGLSKQKHYKVATTTLNAVMDENSLKQLDLIKLDTECTEHYILKSSLDTIKKHQPIIICEVYNVIENEVEQVISSLPGYAIYYYQNHKLKRINRFKETGGNSEEDRNFVFCPKSKIDRIEKFLLN